MTHDEIMALPDDELDCAVAVEHGWVKSGIVIPCWVNHGKYVIDVADYHPSTNGHQLLEIIAREKISANFEFNGCWSADNYTFDQAEQESTALGNTINQAVLRCYLASKQGGKNGESTV